VRPALKQGLLPVWRDRDTLQIGIDSRRAVALTGLGGAAWLLSLLDGSRDRAQVIAAAVNRGLPASLADHVLTLLAAAGALDDYPAATLRALTQAERARLAPELADASLAHGDTDGGARILARRQAARIHVCGPGPITPAIAAILAKAGVSAAVCTSTWPVPPPATRPGRPRPVRRPAPAAPPVRATNPASRTADDAAPGAHQSGRQNRKGQPAVTAGEAGVSAERRPAAGARSGRIASAALAPDAPAGDPAKPSSMPPGRRAASPASPATQDAQQMTVPARRAPVASRQTRELLAGREPRPDLVVLVGVPDPQMGERLVADALPHLVASGQEAIGIVGPLVVPGRTACLRCLDLTRAELDPAWPLILAQLAGRQAEPPACGAVLTAAVAALAAAQALLFVDRPGRAGPAWNGTLELEMPGWQWRRRTWLPHPDCTCARRPRPPFDC
jgi:bacteriocin biosynthesis cyclodehydratase domain-containing protein